MEELVGRGGRQVGMGQGPRSGGPTACDAGEAGQHTRAHRPVPQTQMLNLSTSYFVGTLAEL